MLLLPAIALAVWLFIGHIVLMVTIANRFLFCMADQPLKPTIYALHVALWPSLPLMIVGFVGLDGLGPAFLGDPPDLAGRLWPWLWFVSLAPIYGAAHAWVWHARRKVPPELTRHVRRVLPGDASCLRSVGARLAARWDLARVEIAELTLAIPDLPEPLDGLRLAHLTDLHYDGELSDSLLSVAFREVRAKQPDLVLLTGDFVVRARDLPGCAEALPGLVEGLPAYAVLGNHDIWAGKEEVDRVVRESGAVVLHNERVRFERGGASLWIAGVEDFWDPATDLDAALDGIPPGEPVVLLAHNPDHILAAAQRGVTLQLSGHTHGGQIALPVLGPFVVPSRHGRRFAAGLHKVGDTLLYVNRGLAVHPPVRIGSIPQAALITLTCEAAIAHTT